MKDYTNWKRENESPGERSLTETDPARRLLAEDETRKDLLKPIQQLICDVHEEALAPGQPDIFKLLHATKRMVSMMGRVALEHERTSTLLVRLTRVLVVLTVVMLLKMP